MSSRSFAINSLLVLSAIRLVPHILVARLHAKREVIGLDLERWSSILYVSGRPLGERHRLYCFVRLMTFFPEYRSLFYHRIGWIGEVLALLCRPMPALYLTTRDIGPGLFIRHGFSTIVAAKRVGSNCQIFQQVTIGFTTPPECPRIGDNVVIHAGAKVIGNIKVGNDSVVGANAVVVKDVPENCTVVGVPAYIVRRNGVKTKEPL